MAATSERVLPFNRLAIEKAAPIDGKETEYRVEGVRGLIVRARPSGRSAYYFYYDVQQGKRRKKRKLPLGQIDALTPAMARTKADELRTAVASGQDPAGDKNKRRNAITLAELIQQRFTKDIDLADTTRSSYEKSLAKDVIPKIGHLPADEVTPEAIVDVLDAIEARGARRQADHTRSAIGSTYKWGMTRRIVKHDPTRELGKRATSTPRTARPTDEQIKAIWRATEDPKAPLSQGMRWAIRLAILTGQRRSQIAGARVAEFSSDGSQVTWTIPGDTNVRGKTIKGRMKNKQEQVVPLPSQAKQIVQKAMEAAREHECLFPADLSKVKIGKQPAVPHMSAHSVSTAITRLTKRLGIKDITLHDLRRSIATWLADQGERPDVIEAVLSHKARDVTRMHYNHSKLEPLVRNALQRWADHVEAVVAGKPERSNVTYLAEVG